jgi:hypothetical protein
MLISQANMMLMPGVFSMYMSRTMFKSCNKRTNYQHVDA